MPIQQDQLVPLRTTVTFEEFNTLRTDRVIHNGSDFIKLRAGYLNPTNPILTYFTTDGDIASSYTMEEDYVFDISYDRSQDKYYQIRYRFDRTDNEITSTTGIPAITTWNDDFSETILGIEYPLDTGQTVPNNEFLNPYRWNPYISPVLKRDTVNDRLIFKRPFGEQNSEEIIKFDGNELAVSSGYTVSIDYNFPFMNDLTKADAECDLKITNRFTISGIGIDNPFEREVDYYTVGASTSGGTGRRYRVAVSGADDITGINAIYFGKIAVPSGGGEDLADLATTFSDDELQVTATCITGAALEASKSNITWDVNYKIGALDITVTGAITDPAYSYSNDYFEINLRNETFNDFGWLKCTAGESLGFSYYIDYFTSATTTGVLDITRSFAGQNVTYSTSLNGAYDITHDSSQQITASGVSDVRLRAASNEFENTTVYFDNFTVTSGAVGEIISVIRAGDTSEEDVSYYTIALDEIDNEGQVVSNIVQRLNILPEGGKGNATVLTSFTPLAQSGIVSLAVDDSNGAYVKVGEDIYRVNVTGTYNPSTYYTDSSPDIDLSTSILSYSATYSLQYNNTVGGFLQYVEYDDNTHEVRLKTLNVSGSTAPVLSSREVFLDIPDWDEYADTTNPYQFTLHAIDNNTLFYFRRHGTGQLNPSKSEGTDGERIGLNLLVSDSANFILDEVKVGDVVILEGTITSFVDQVVSSTTLQLTSSAGAGTDLDYTVSTNADLMQFNTDPSLSAFASVNVDDFSLRAGTSDTTTVRAEVINAWGDPLNGKTVAFIVSDGDGVVTPGSTTTNVSGVANAQYQAGTNPGAVEITATVSD